MFLPTKLLVLSKIGKFLKMQEMEFSKFSTERQELSYDKKQRNTNKKKAKWKKFSCKFFGYTFSGWVGNFFQILHFLGKKISQFQPKKPPVFLLLQKTFRFFLLIFTNFSLWTTSETLSPPWTWMNAVCVCVYLK